MEMMRKAKNLIVILGIASLGTAVISSCGGGGNNTTGNNNTASAGSSASGDNSVLLGAGSTFVYPLFSKIFSAYYDSTKIKVNYQSIGSGGGILQLTNKTVDFGGTDAPLNEEQTKKIGQDVLHVPMASGADVVSYNLTGVKDTLKLTPEVIANIFLGKVKSWNDQSIQSLNPNVKLPSLPVMVIHRSDGSGTSFIWTDYLSKVSDEWKTKVGKGTAVKWPAGLGGKGNEGVAGLIRQTPGAIGYIELAYAIQNKMSVAAVKNKSGNFVTPTLNSITAAGNIDLPADAKVSITNTDAKNGYPISSFTWAIFYKEQNYNGRSQEKAQNLLKLMWYNVHGGQKFCKQLNYAPLSPSALAVAEKILKSATYNGKNILQ